MENEETRASCDEEKKFEKSKKTRRIETPLCLSCPSIIALCLLLSVAIFRFLVFLCRNRPSFSRGFLQFRYSISLCITTFGCWLAWRIVLIIQCFVDSFLWFPLARCFNWSDLNRADTHRIHSRSNKQTIHEVTKLRSDLIGGWHSKTNFFHVNGNNRSVISEKRLQVSIVTCTANDRPIKKMVIFLEGRLIVRFGRIIWIECFTALFIQPIHVLQMIAQNNGHGDYHRLNYRFCRSD